MHKFFYLAILFVWAGSALATTLSIPLDSLEPWQVLSYRKIPPNKVSADATGLSVSVDGSASPLIFALSGPTRVSAVHVTATWDGELSLPADAVQGERGADDFVLKLGLVEAGTQTLNWLQRKLAADWVNTLFRLAPRGSGVDRIHFISTAQQAALLGTQRMHPLSDLLYETRVTHLARAGAFEIIYTLQQPTDVLALWVSADGDDTNSRFTLRIEEIILTVEP